LANQLSLQLDKLLILTRELKTGCGHLMSPQQHLYSVPANWMGLC